MARTLQIGCTPGSDVAALQDDLNRAATLPSQASQLAPLAADGIFGSGTRARVVEFQKANLLNPDGIVGPLTTAKLAGVLSNPGGELPITRPAGGSSPGGPEKSSGTDPGGKWYVPGTGTKTGEPVTPATKWGDTAGVKGGGGPGTKGGGGKWF
jgi:peptidoglycan hydrolase-like protein with peptidoglycan-binding domain